jgi:two-component system NtrC family response regulator
MRQPSADLHDISVVREIREELDWAAHSSARVLITGESGAGKETIARFIHQHSARASAPFVALNCAGVPDAILASQLFGHVRGTFSDADRDAPGWLQQLNAGTLLLHRVGQMSLEIQEKLVNFLETGKIRPMGTGDVRSRSGVRIMSADRNLYDDMVAGRFREDLYYRLNIIHIVVTRPLAKVQSIPRAQVAEGTPFLRAWGRQ